MTSTSLARKLVVQIATPYATGTGFIMSAQGVIVTNEHVVRDNIQVVIEGQAFARQQTRVLYQDEKYDLAILALPAPGSHCKHWSGLKRRHWQVMKYWLADIPLVINWQ